MIVALGLKVISAGLRRGRRKEPGGGERQERGVLLELHVVKRGLPFGRALSIHLASAGCHPAQHLRLLSILNLYNQMFHALVGELHFHKT